MSANCVFIKVNKKDGFVRENNWEPIDIISCRYFNEYLEDVLGLPTLEIGDSVCFLDDYKLNYVDIENKSSFETYEKVMAKRMSELLSGKCDVEINYRMTEGRAHTLIEAFGVWSKGKTSEVTKCIKNCLKELKDFINEVNFEKENMIFSYHY